MTKTKRYIPEILIATIVLLIVLIWSYGQIMVLNDDEFAYAADDAYIHMAMARSFGEAGVWGVTPYLPSSTTSSPLWTFLLSGLPLITNNMLFAPLILNSLLAILILVSIAELFYRWNINRYLTLVVLLVTIFIVPLTTQIFIGMEHLLQALLTVIFIYIIYPILTDPNKRFNRWVYIVTVLFALTRYENLFVIAMVCGLLVLRRHWRSGIGLGIVALLPIVAYGLFSIAQGGLFLPNSVYIKSTARYTRDLNDVLGFLNLGEVITSLNNSGFLIPMILLMLLTFGWIISKRQIWILPVQIAFVAIGATLLHARFAELIGLLGRYDAYLVVLYIVSLVAFLKNIPDKHNTRLHQMVAILGLLISIGIFGSLRLISIVAVIQGTHDIYTQQVQMGRFLQTYYPTARVVVMDIGAVNYYTDIYHVDTIGLGSNDVAQYIANGGVIDKAYLSNLAQTHHTELAIIYDVKYVGRVPDEWIRIAQWTIPEVIIAGDNTVSFYAINPDITDTLRDNLDAYTELLPDGVIYEPDDLP